MEIVRQGSTFDVCVIGSGPAGGFMAKELTEAGAKVLLLEAGGSDVKPVIQDPARLGERVAGREGGASGADRGR